MSTPPQPTNFKFNNQGLVNADLDDVFVRKSSLFQTQCATLWGWGPQSGAFTGILGSSLSGTQNQSSPVQHVSTTTKWSCIGGGRLTAAGIKTDGTLWTWGNNLQGRFGNNAQGGYSSSPVQTVATGTNWKTLSLGQGFVSSVKTDGTLWLWGYGGIGQMGTNDTINRSSPVQTVATGTNWKCVVSGCYTGGGLKIDGTLWVWGRNNTGQMGTNDTINRSSPVQTVATGTNWRTLAMGDGTVAAVKTDGTMWVWSSGILRGNSTVLGTSSPVQHWTGGSNWRSVSVTNSYKATAVGLKTDGTLWMWGYDTYFGEPGDNIRNLRNVSSPVQTVATGTNWKCAIVNSQQVTALKTDGTLWLWGRNFSGSLGDNTTIHRSSPVQTVTTGTNWVSFSVGGQGSFGSCGAFVLALRQ